MIAAAGELDAAGELWGKRLCIEKCGFFFMLSEKPRAQRAGAQRRRYRGAKRRVAAQGAA